MNSTEIYNLLAQKIPIDNILQDESMKRHTSFKIGGDAEFFVKVKNIEEIKYILNICKNNNIPLTIVGNGSNLLVKDNGIKGITMKIEIDTIKIEEIDKIEKNIVNETTENTKINVENDTTENTEITEKNNEYDFQYIINKENQNENLKQIDNESYAIITVGAGVPLGKLAQILLKKSISGFEFASGIPGTIGGAIKMNAGAYGSEFKDIVIETTCINLDGKIFKLNNEQQKFEYRKSIFKDEEYIILESKLLLKYVEDSKIIKEKMDEYKKSRLEKQPIEYPSAGSTFKRGNDFITAKLIDECGLKGYSIGGARVSEKHAGFIINAGNATAEDVLKLINFIKSEVFKKFEKKIELEVEVIE